MPNGRNCSRFDWQSCSRVADSTSKSVQASLGRVQPLKLVTWAGEDCRRFDGRVAVERSSLSDYLKAKAQYLRQYLTVDSLFEIQAETADDPPMLFQILTLSHATSSSRRVCSCVVPSSSLLPTHQNALSLKLGGPQRMCGASRLEEGQPNENKSKRMTRKPR